MSIFAPTETETSCEICQHRPVKKPEGKKVHKRCEYCQSRYDPSGKAYIIAADIYRFQSVRRHNVYIWVCDGRVNQIKGPAISHLVGLYNKEKNFMMDFMKSKNYRMISKSDASI